MAITIFSVPGDAHSIIVSHALRTLGVEHRRFFLTNLPQKADFSYALSDDAARLSLRHAGAALSSGPNSVWFRRIGGAVLGDIAHPHDREFAVGDWIDVVASIRLSFCAADAFCINDPRAQRSADNKAYQLECARRSGLRIPATLVTNSQADALAFIAANRRRGHRTVVKPFSPMLWYSTHEAHVASTAVVIPEDVEGSNLRASPAIFQVLVEKAYEVRVTVMGAAMLASRHHIPAELRADIVDFRLLEDWSRLSVAPVELPNELRDGISRTMAMLGLVFGSLDFLVDAEGNWLFLEVNEQGNFLWQETYAPDLPLLDAFCGFLEAGSASFTHPTHRRPRLRLSDVRRDLDLEAAVAQEKADNIVPTGGTGVSEGT